MRLWWRIAQRYYEARCRRALRLAGVSSASAAHFKSQSEKFFHKIKGARKL